jgi:endonuclease/exonuclease/phosphatase family metal-dependent hydrolase
MCRRTSLLVCSVLLLALSSAALTAQQAIRVATWNVEALGSSGSTQWNRAQDVLMRVDADIVAIQEVDGLFEALSLAGFASGAGYPHSAVGGTSGTLSGDLANGVISKWPIVFQQSWTAAAISGDPSANDITRDIFEAHVQVPNLTEVVGVFSVHLKAGSGGTNDFRRAVEIQRLASVVNNFKALHPNSPFFVCGDLNDDIGDGGFGGSFNSPPSGLPSSFDLGNDIGFPLSYNPFVAIQGLGTQIVTATQEDSSVIDATRPASGRRLDYIFHGGGTTNLGDEVYNSSRDNGFDDAPLGFWLPKTGSPLPSSWSLDAADHLTVFAEIDLPVVLPLYQGSLDDFVMETSINGAPFTTGAGNDVRTGGDGDLLNVHYFSPNETLSGVGNAPVIVAQIFASSGLPPIGTLPGMWFDLSNYLVLYDGLSNPSGFAPVVPPFTGAYHSFVIPPNAANLQVMIQSVIISPNVNNGFVGFSDGHRLDIAF